MFFLLFLLFAANGFFSLGPWWHRPGVFHVADVGNVLIWAGLLVVLVFGRDRRIFWNPVSVLMISYVVLVIFHMFLASYYYGQSFLDGLIAVRHQFYYLSFFLFLVILDDTKKIERLLNIIVYVSVGLVLLAVINYFGPTVFSHRWAEGQGIRAGITRAFIPGMSAISLSVIWVFTKWINSDEAGERRGAMWTTFILLTAIFFRQTRMRLLSLTAVMLSAMVLKRRWKPLAAFVILFVLAAGVISLRMRENLVVKPFSSTYSDVVDRTGTWGIRMRQLELDFEEFSRHPLIGSGVSALRAPEKGTRLQRAMAEVAYQSDLGYTHWMKSYGILGVVWLAFFFYIQFAMVIRAARKSDGLDRKLALFSLSYLSYMALSFLTLNHLMFPFYSFMIIMNAAIIVRLYYKTHPASTAPARSRKPEDRPRVEDAPAVS